MLDVDGVVVTGRPADGAGWATSIERDLGITSQALQAKFFAPHWRDIVTGRRDLAAVLAQVLPALAPGVDAARFIAYWFAHDARLEPAVLAECAALRRAGVRVLLATNQEHLRARYLMETLGLADHVDGMIYSADVGVAKPHPAFFAAAAARSRVSPSEIALVDDTMANITAARAAGWAAHHWTPGASLPALLGR
ncbi:HAD-IA family hydrolase [Acuticoccus sp. I52.16.1]|uniref:HAD-IA family hydrolase n=1 Tax=Acuticoccus sp. I52.16.1 TaxID=2928472 RepID=UPI001FD3C73A|nr:HAD-IA family hydrolase [Acuticoccus sp. I52.16.1]UOM33303.1 HAD-IA family hydrolase [Acuticoccus sp. I52.16.1]